LASQQQIESKKEPVMPFTQDLSVSYHQQDTDYYCGAACAQMVLDSIGAGLLDQDDLYHDNNSHSTAEGGWYSGPDGVTWTLNNRKPASFGNYFVLFTPTNEDSISRKIVWTIHHYQVGPVAMVYHSAHWLVVRGYTASAAPANYADTSFSISGFMVNNPWPPVPSWYNATLAPPPPHSSSDGCGAGGNRGIVDEHISYTAWQDTYMTGVQGGHWAGQYLAVCDPEPLPERVGRPGFVGKRVVSERLLSAQDAVSLSREGLEEYGLLELENYRQILRRVNFGQAVLVQRLDRPDSYYYVVPATEAENVPLAVLVNARTGEYLQSAVQRSDRGSVFQITDPKAIRERVLGKRFELPEQAGRLIIRPEAFCQYPVLVWKPCRESLSPLYPFHLFTAGSNRLYVRVDGAVFTALHDTDRGI
jgi:hypothetical protein